MDWISVTSSIGLQTPDDWFHLFWFGLVGLDSKFNNFMDFLNQTRLDKMGVRVYLTNFVCRWFRLNQNVCLLPVYKDLNLVLSIYSQASIFCFATILAVPAGQTIECIFFWHFPISLYFETGSSVRLYVGCQWYINTSPVFRCTEESEASLTDSQLLEGWWYMDASGFWPLSE